MSLLLQGLLRDWAEESSTLAGVLQTITPEDWDRQTPAPAWSIRQQVAHLAWTDEVLQLSCTSPEEFEELRSRVSNDTESAINDAAAVGAKAAPETILKRWTTGQRRTALALSRSDARRKINWFGPPMSPAAAVTARIMETFAHGQDIRDALSLAPIPSPRLRHIAHLAVATRAYSFGANRLEAPTDDIRVELSYNGEIWSWGSEDAKQHVVGDALDFALLATRRRHREDCALRATGPGANSWLEVIQAYAGSPGQGRTPLSPSLAP